MARRKISGKKLALWVSAISATAAVASFAVAFWSVQSSWQLAHRSGALRHPQLNLYVDEYRLSPDEPIRLIYGIPSTTATTCGLRVLSGVLQLRVRNDGDGVASGARLVLTLDRETLYPTFHKFPPPVLPTDRPVLSREVTGPEYLPQVAYLLPELRPDESALIEEPLLWTSHSEEAAGLRKTKPYQTVFVWRPSVYIVSPDARGIHYGFELTGVRADGLDALEQFGKAEAGHIQRRRESRVAYAWRLIRGVSWPILLIRAEPLVDAIEVKPDECALKHDWFWVAMERFPIRTLRHALW